MQLDIMFRFTIDNYNNQVYGYEFFSAYSIATFSNFRQSIGSSLNALSHLLDSECSKEFIGFNMCDFFFFTLMKPR